MEINNDPKIFSFKSCYNDFFERFGKIFWHDRISWNAWHYDIPEKPFIIAKSIDDADIRDKSKIGHPICTELTSENDFDKFEKLI